MVAMAQAGVTKTGDVTTAAPPAPEPPLDYAPTWLTNYAAALAVVDAVAMTIAAIVALRFRFGDSIATLESVGYDVISAALVPTWVVAMLVGRTYESRFLGTGSDEYRRVFDTAIRLTALVAIAAYVLKVPVSRGYVGIAFPLGTALTLAGRYGARQVVHRLRRQDRCMHRTVVVGERASAADLTRQLSREPSSGFAVVAACVPGGGEMLDIDGTPVPILGPISSVADVVRTVKADTVAVASSRAVNATVLRRLSWELEGSGIDVVVAPSLVDVAGPRIHVRPVAGLPLLHVEEPDFSGSRRVVKRVFDVVAALALIVVLSPLLLAIWLAVRLTSPGPGLFTQTRVGRGGETFRIWKFRSMHRDAEARVIDLVERNESEGPLFKMRDDPRVTRVGRILRRYSLDELPQLFNVLAGTMSLVGPRPPLPAEVEQYEVDVRRRLLVQPGVTGLWQISGRSDLPWDEAVRLDLYYVENWSVTLDLAILIKTVLVVLKRKGAY
jgi:exopolysaccharide biosynthesis polyprenyl glycosylphosphotransferase